MVVAVAVVALIVSVIITVVYKFTTNQSLMRDLKNELKEFQKEMKELRNHPEKAMEIQKKSMETNMKYMSHSMKSTLFTLIPIIIIFGWANAHLAFEPILPGQEFTVEAVFARGMSGTINLIAPEGIEVLGNSSRVVEDGKVVWVLKGVEGDYVKGNAIQFEFNDQVAYKDVIITTEQRYAKVMEGIKGVYGLKTIKINNESKKIMDLPFSLLGFRGGWLGVYIIFSMIFSTILRKWMKVY
ncbi:DUF106 domain-containing protein [Candidatus Woesearchaeota archaeon]|nr:DUF106 domain-containing protein [Candidatus Woesearchaeota archaeon]